MKVLEFTKTHQQKIVLSAGYLLVALLAFGLGRLTAYKYKVPNVRVEEVFATPLDNTANSGSVQSASVDNCEGKIKGNINSKGEKIYHMPQGSFYNRTDPEQCFNTEAEAKTAGFRRSSQ
jgi:competence protein ComEC